jgi:hypothetical protein
LGEGASGENGDRGVINAGELCKEEKKLIGERGAIEMAVDIAGEKESSLPGDLFTDARPSLVPMW